LFAVAEIREVEYNDRTGIYWLGSYPFPLAKRDVSFFAIDKNVLVVVFDN